MQASAFSILLLRESPVILDGGLATELEAQGHDLSSALWSSALLRSNPRAIVDAHRAYFDAGAEIAISASYNASRAGFHQLGVGGDEADRLIASSVALAREACDEFAADNPGAGVRLVAASVGPYGAVLNDGSEYTGNYGVSRNVLHQFHEHRMRILDRAGADVLACETIPSRLEAIVLAELLADVVTPAWVCFSCRNAQEISDGTPIDEVCAIFREHPRVLALGVNCTAPQHVASLIEKIRCAAPNKSVVVYPNSGESYDAGSMDWSGSVGVDDAVAYVPDWLAAGATLIGGCCRVGPAQIRAIADTLRS